MALKVWTMAAGRISRMLKQSPVIADVHRLDTNTQKRKSIYYSGFRVNGLFSSSKTCSENAGSDQNTAVEKKLRGGSYENRWKEMLSGLRDYISKHGNANVPLTHPRLGRWVRFQRLQYRLFQDGETNCISRSRIRELDNLGFLWNVHELKWETKYQELAQFHREHGHSLVPNLKDSSLGIWLHTQRNQYYLYRDGKPSSMTERRIAKLEALDFPWDAREAMWQERFNELCEYHEAHGDCLVPKHLPENPSLGLWVHTQRSQYKQWKGGKSTWLTKERIDLLESVGFEWSAHDAAWTRNYNLLVEVVTGNGTLPKSLATWARAQRQNYRKRLRGEKSPLTDDRIEKLNRMGFNW